MVHTGTRRYTRNRPNSTASVKDKSEVKPVRAWWCRRRDPRKRATKESCRLQTSDSSTGGKDYHDPLLDLMCSNNDSSHTPFCENQKICDPPCCRPELWRRGWLDVREDAETAERSSASASRIVYLNINTRRDICPRSQTRSSPAPR